MTVPIVPVVPTEIGTFGENVYTDSTSGQLPTYDPSQYILSLKLSSKYGSTPTVTEILPTYIDKLKVFRIVSRGGYHQSLEMVFDDSDNVLSGLGAFAEGSALSVAIQYTKISDSTVTSYNVGVYFVSSLLAEDDTLSITADTLVERMGDISVEGSIFLASTDFAPQLGSLLTSLHIPTNIGTTPSTSGYKIDRDTTLPRMSLWDMIECYNCDRRSRNSASWTFASRIVVKPDGKVGYVSTLHTAPRYDIYRTDMVTEPKRVSDAIYNYVQLMYDETNCYYRDKRTSSGDDVRVLTYDNPFIKTLNRATRCSALTPPENVTPIWSVDVIAKIPLDYMIHEMIRVHRKDSTAEHERYDYAIITGVSYEYDGGTIIATLDYVLEDDVYAVFATGTTTITDAQRYGEYVASKQDELVSGTNIKTINNQSILGSGNIEISGGEGNYVTVDTAQSITGEKTFLADNAFCTVNIKTTRTSGNIGGINFRANDGTTKAQIYGTIGGELISMTSPNNNSAFGCIVTKGSLASMSELVHTTGNETIAGVKSFMSDLNIGSSSTSANLNVYGNITLNGEAYEVHAEKIFTKNDYIIMRDGAVSGLASGDYSGFQIRKYDGTNDGRLVVDNEGVARVGDVGDEQPLLTRSDSGSMTADQALKWDATNFKAVTSGYVLGDACAKAVFSRNNKGDIGWATEANRTKVLETSAIAWWNGAYQGTSSNLTYCVKGEFGNACIKNVDTAVTENSTNLITSGGVFTKLASYNAPTASKLQTARTISLAGMVTGSVSFDGSNNVTINTVRRSATFGITNQYTTATWFKVASWSTTSQHQDTQIRFRVFAGYSDGSNETGRLTIHVRSGNNRQWDNSQIQWEYAGSGVNTAHFVLLHTPNTVTTGTTVELWCMANESYRRHILEVDNEGGNSTSTFNNWTLYNAFYSIPSDLASYTEVAGSRYINDVSVLPSGTSCIGFAQYISNSGYTRQDSVIATQCAIKTNNFTSYNTLYRVNSSWDSTNRPSSGTQYNPAFYLNDSSNRTVGWVECFKNTTSQGIQLGCRSYDKGASSPVVYSMPIYHDYAEDEWFINLPTIFSAYYRGLNRKTKTATKGTPPSSAMWLRSNIDFVRISTDDAGKCGTAYANRIYEDRQYLDTGGNVRLDFIAYSFNPNKGGAQVSIFNNYDGSQYMTTPYRAYSSAGQYEILTKGHIASISDLVHTTGNETIAGTKTFSNNIVGSIDRASADGDGNVISATYLKLSGGSMTGALFAKAEDIGAGYSHAKVRNIIISTSAPTGGSNGDIWLQYDA